MIEGKASLTRNIKVFIVCRLWKGINDVWFTTNPIWNGPYKMRKIGAFGVAAGTVVSALSSYDGSSESGECAGYQDFLFITSNSEFSIGLPGSAVSAIQKVA